MNKSELVEALKKDIEDRAAEFLASEVEKKIERYDVVVHGRYDVDDIEYDHENETLTIRICSTEP